MASVLKDVSKYGGRERVVPNPHTIHQASPSFLVLVRVGEKGSPQPLSLEDLERFHVNRGAACTQGLADNSGT